MIARDLGAVVKEGRNAINHKSLGRVRFRVDTFHFDELKCPMQRYENRDLHAAYGDNTGVNLTITELVKMQEDLNNMNRYLLQRREITWYTVGKSLNWIKQNNPKFNLTLYEAEYDCYLKCSKAIGAKELEQAQLKMKQEAEKREIARLEEAEKRRVDDSLNAIRQRERAIEEEKMARQRATEEQLEEVVAELEKQERHRKLVSKYGASNAKLIENGKVKIGMTKAMCLESWGEPYDINKTVTAKKVTEQWVYSLDSYLYFVNGILTTIQN